MQIPTSLAEVVKLAAAKAKANGGRLAQERGESSDLDLSTLYLYDN